MSKKKSSNNGIVYSTDPTFRPTEDTQEQRETLPPSKQLLRLRFETKHRAGKTVTIISGFIGRDEHLEDLGKKIKSFCGTGGSIKDGEIIIQGDHRQKILDWLKKTGYASAK